MQNPQTSLKFDLQWNLDYFTSFWTLREVENVRFFSSVKCNNWSMTGLTQKVSVIFVKINHLVKKRPDNRP